MVRFARFPCSLLLLMVSLALVVGLGGCDDGAATGAGTDPDGQARAATHERTPDIPPPSKNPVVRDLPAPRADAPVAGRDAPSGPGPGIAFERIEHDFGTVSDIGQYRTAFAFTNTGTETLVIGEIKAGCGCTIPSLAKKEYVPGESGEIDVVFNPRGKSGSTPRSVRVFTNARSEPYMLTFNSDVRPMFETEQKFLRFGTLSIGEPHTRTLTFTYQDPDLEVRSVTTNHDDIEAKLLEIGDIRTNPDGTTIHEGTIEVHLAETLPWGTLFATQLWIDVTGTPIDSEAPRNERYVVYLQGDVFGELQCITTGNGRRTSPGTVMSVGLVQPGESFEYDARITRVSGEPFEILGTSVEEQGILESLDIGVEPAGRGMYRIVVNGTVGQHRGQVQSVVKVQTDVPGEEALTLRLTGRVN